MSEVKMTDRTNICKRFNADGTCSIAEKPCWYTVNRSVCACNSHYEYLTATGEPPITTEIKKRMLPRVVQLWKERGGTGARNMAGRPFEDVTSDMFKEKLGHLNVEIKTRKEFFIAPGVRTIADIRIEKPDYPTSVISTKTYVDNDVFRNCFGDAYFTKSMYGMLKIRFYITVLLPKAFSDGLMKMAKSHIDGLYQLSGEPYVDELFGLLEEMYKERARTLETYDS